MIGHQVTVLLNHNWGQKYENPRLRICKMRKNVCAYRNLQLKNNRQKKLNHQPYGWPFFSSKRSKTITNRSNNM